MSPTLEPGDRIVVRRADGAEVHRGDLVIVDSGAFDQPSHEGISVFRVGAVAGDTVACRTGAIFVGGDNRGNSDDSRFQGPARLSGVTGFVVATGTVVTPKPLPAVTAFTDAGLPGAPLTDSTLGTLKWWILGGFVLFAAGLIGLIVTVVRNAGRRRRAAAIPPVH
ncbi:S26 family signal peptidase [Amycolatopsis pretoriensis]